MKNLKLILSMLLVIGVFTAVLVSCNNDDNNGPSELKITAITADDVDLNGATSPTNVSIEPTVTITFNTDVDASTATADNIKVVRDYDQAVVSTDVQASGKTVTITPAQSLASGALYVITLGSGLKTKDGKAFTEITRSFTTAGTFAPTGAIASWTFEDNANDIVGTFDPAATDVVAINYVTGRNANSGKAASFNGTTSIIEIPNGPLLVNTNDFALSIWIKPDSILHNGGNFVLGIGGSKGFQFELNRNDAKLAAQYDLGDGSSNSSDLWIDGTGNLGWPGWTFSKDFSSQGGFKAVVHQKWTHFVFVYESATRVGTAYINGEKVKSQDFDNWPDGSAERGITGLKFSAADGIGEKLALGFIDDRSSTFFDYGIYSNTNLNHYKGEMDDVIIYHKVVTPQEVTLMYNSGKP
jgi:hypothetical protein